MKTQQRKWGFHGPTVTIGATVAKSGKEACCPEIFTLKSLDSLKVME
jgi:hypothetical protein